MREYLPLDPECPVASDYIDTLLDDPMTAYSGCVDEILEAFEAKHRRACERCRAYGVANIEVNA